MQRPVEIILTRQLADSLSMPVMVVDAAGVLIFYNEAAHKLLGRAFEEADEASIREISSAIRTTDEAGMAMDGADLPLVRALREGRPCHGRLRITGLDGVKRLIEVTAMPLVGQGSRLLGARAIFGELDQPGSVPG